jgi:hypothetical protein
MVSSRNVLAKVPKRGVWGESSAGGFRRQSHPGKDSGN